MPTYRPEALAVLDVAPVLEVGQLVVKLVRLHVETGRLDALPFEFDVRCQGSALGFKLELFVVVSSVSLDFGEGCGVVEGTGRFSQGVIRMTIGVEELHEPAWHGGRGSL